MNKRQKIQGKCTNIIKLYQIKFGAKIIFPQFYTVILTFMYRFPGDRNN